jgi:hypothetical protein
MTYTLCFKITYKYLDFQRTVIAKIDVPEYTPYEFQEFELLDDLVQEELNIWGAEVGWVETRNHELLAGDSDITIENISLLMFWKLRGEGLQGIHGAPNYVSTFKY